MIEKMNFLQDLPLDKEELQEARFGHKKIAELISDIIKNVKSPFTIGLFGGWGVGKSTIINCIKDFLKKDDIPLIIFDVWKHEGDALRRTFLKECEKQLKQQKISDYKLNERVEYNVQTSLEDAKFSWELLFKSWKFNLSIVLFIFVIIKLMELILLNQTISFNIKDIPKLFFSIFIMFSIWALNNLQAFRISSVKTKSQDRFLDPLHFEDEFKKVLNGIKKHNRILIVFDNLDRVSKKVGMDILTTIKTFLEPNDKEIKSKSVIFLIPCDDEAIQKHIEQTSYANLDKKKQKEASSEFLNKFFNCKIRIPKFIDSELKEYTMEMINKTNYSILYDNTVAWLIIKGYRDNPRQIKQFINNLLATCLLIENQIKIKEIDKGFLKKNILELTKFKLIEQKFCPELLKIIKKGYKLDYKKIQEDGLFEKGHEEFMEFIFETKEIEIKNLLFFSNLRQSDSEKEIQGVDELMKFMEDGKNDEAIKRFKELKINNHNKLDKFVNISEDYLQKLKISEFSRDFINSLLNIMNTYNLELNSLFYIEITNKIEDLIKEKINVISPKLLYESLILKYAKSEDILLKLWFKILEDNTPYSLQKEQELEFMSLIFNKKIKLNQNDLLIFKSLFNENQYISREEFQDLIYKMSDEDQEYFLDEKVIDKFVVEKLSDEEFIEKNIKTILNLSKNLFTEKAFSNIIGTINRVISQKDVPEEFLLDFNLYIKKFRDFYSKKDSNIITTHLNTIINLINLFPTPEEKIYLMPIYLNILDLVDTNQKVTINSHIQIILNSYSVELLEKMFDEEVKIKILDNPDFLNILKNRSIQDTDFFIFISKFLQPVLKNEFIMAIFRNNIGVGNKIIKTLDYKVSNKSEILNECLSKLNHSQPQREIIIEIAIKFKLGNSENKLLFVDKLIELFEYNNIDIQKFALSSLKKSIPFFNKDNLRKITKELLEWLNKNNNFDGFLVFEAIYLGYNSLNNEEKKQFIHIMFDKVIKLSTNLDSLNNVFDIIEKINPKYNSRKENFDDILNRINNEGNPPIKKVLIDGILRLKPKKIIKKEGIFWNNVEKIFNDMKKVS